MPRHKLHNSSADVPFLAAVDVFAALSQGAVLWELGRFTAARDCATIAREIVP